VPLRETDVNKNKATTATTAAATTICIELKILLIIYNTSGRFFLSLFYALKSKKTAKLAFDEKFFFQRSKEEAKTERRRQL